MPILPSINIIRHKSVTDTLGAFVSLFSLQKCNLLRDQLEIPSAKIADSKVQSKPDVSVEFVKLDKTNDRLHKALKLPFLCAW